MTTSPTAAHHPRSVTPGIESHSPHEQGPKLPLPGVYCRLDWIRMVGGENGREDVQTSVQELLGDDWRTSNGAMHFRYGETLDPGVQMSWGHRSEIAMIDIRGERLAIVTAEEGIHLMDAAARHGWHATRLDGCLDFIGQQRNIYDKAVSSCEAGELCVLRSWNPDAAFGPGNTPTKRLLKLGKRVSTVCARIYDKGLQTSTAPIGHWERIEVEWKKDRAQQMMFTLHRAKSKWVQVLADHVVGAFEFREHTGRRELDRRAVSPWWKHLTAEMKPTATPASEQQPDWERWCSWLRAAVLPRLLQIAERSSISPETLLLYLADGVAPRLTEDPFLTQAQEALQAAGHTQ